VSVVTNLCVMTSGPTGRLYVTHLHPGVSRAEVEENTGFRVDWAPDVAVTSPPSPAERRLLDEQIDPRGLRFLEVLSGAARRTRLRALADQELSP
jgi:hypothetical protein